MASTGITTLIKTMEWLSVVTDRKVVIDMTNNTTDAIFTTPQ